ncbi:aldo/keto reductase [Shumkonia mesophila]|uniref:aldo/keto reductase n=1 Tax=Shumkonia mesophila TaxID=2838854 RepID=UPI002934C123|nr:aldo/keto reductase [Shumkonia mesophila]
MKYRRLAGTDLDVSVICLGPMRAAAKTPGGDARSKAGEAALRAALDAGINFLHSSYEYETRWMMERVLRDHPKRHDVHHVIKVPVPDFKDGGRFDAAKFRLRVEEALTDLHAERIAVLQWMWRSEPNEDALRLPMLPAVMDDVWATFEKMKAEGKVGHLMTFPYTVPCARAAIETGRFAGLIAYYNPIEMEMAELFPEMERRGMGFLCIRPLYEGILTDARDPARLKADDRFREPRYAKDLARRARIAESFAAEIGASMTGFAVRFALASPLVGSVIVGLNSPAQVEGIAAAVAGDLPDPSLVGRAYDLWKSGFGLDG